MKHTKHLFALFAVLATLPSAASAQYFQSGGLWYNVLSSTEHTVEVTQGNGTNFYHGSITIPPTVTYGGTTYDVVALGEYAFFYATLSSVTIPTSVTQIKGLCFYSANGPAAITVPASVTDIGEMAFAANNMTAINVDSDNPSYTSVDGMLFSKDTSVLYECPLGKSGVIALPQSTRHIAVTAFAWCHSLTGVTLHEGLASIGYGAFVNCTSLDNVVIPSTVTSLKSNLFEGCSALNNLAVASGNSHYYMDGTMLYSIGTDTLLSCHKSADTVVLPATLRAVGGFGGNTDIRHVQLPDSVTTLLENAFEVSTLQSITLPRRMDFIDEYAFFYCESLSHIDLPSVLDSMGAGCFAGCTRLASIALPDGLRVVPQDAFFACEHLTQVTWGDAIEVVDSFAFGGCAITELLLPPTLRVVRNGAFNGYYDGTIRRVVFSAPVDTIEAETFYGQPLRSIWFENSQPPVATTFEGAYGPIDNAAVDSIIIPCGSLGNWLADSYWGHFASCYHEACNGIDDVPGTDAKVYSIGGRIVVEGTDGEPVRIYDIMGRPLKTNNLPLATGIYFVRVGDRPARKVAVLK